MKHVARTHIIFMTFYDTSSLFGQMQLSANNQIPEMEPEGGAKGFQLHPSSFCRVFLLPTDNLECLNITSLNDTG